MDPLGKIPASLTKTVKGIEDLARLRTLRRKAIKVNSLQEWNRIIKEDETNKR